jgi:coenzyme F420-reducing hydrogenase alpha subunit
MARKCTCKLCKAKGTTDVFYKVTDNSGKNRYYCNEKEYVDYMTDKGNREELLKYIALEVFDYEDGQIVNPILLKKIKEMNGFYAYEVIQECFKENKDSIQYWMANKNFTNEYGMISYIMKIIEGNINDIYNKWKYKNKQQVEKDNNNVDVDFINQLDMSEIKTKSEHGILAFLDEEDI